MKPIIRMIVSVAACAGLAYPTQAQQVGPDANDDGLRCLRLYTDLRLYKMDGELPTKDTMNSAIACSRAHRDACLNVMGELKNKGGATFAKYVMECKGSIQPPKPRTGASDEERGCIRLYTDLRLYLMDNASPTNRTMSDAIACSRAQRDNCLNIMEQVKNRGGATFAKYIMECKGG